MLYRVTARLSAPIVIRDDIHLDGLLAAAHPLAHDHPCTRTTPLEDLIKIPIPVLRFGRMALCTAAVFDDDARLGSEYGVRRKDAADLDWLANRFHPGLGPGKNRMDRLPVVRAQSVTWRCWSEGRQGLKRILRRIRYLGARRSHGYGSISSWELEDDVEQDPVSLVVRGTIAQRALHPSYVRWASTYDQGALEPPYWHPGRQTRIVPAGAKVELDPHVIEKILDHVAVMRDKWRTRKSEERMSRANTEPDAQA